MRAVGLLVVTVLCACNTPMKPRVGGKPGEYETPPALVPAVERAATLGRAIWENDVVSARATDVLVQDAKIDWAAEELLGWITFIEGDHFVVQFVKALPDGSLAAAYEIPFQPGSPREDGLQEYDPPVALDPKVAAMFRARTNVLASLKRFCGHGPPNPVVLPAERIGKTGWLVYVLAASNRPEDLVLTGHQLFRVSADGNRIEEELPLTRSCLVGERGKDVVAQVLTSLVGPTPTEAHVFTSLLYRIPLYVGAEGKAWRVEGQNIVFLGVL